jgi:hypothetical protein
MERKEPGSESAIRGSGYGHTHLWARGVTAQVGSDQAHKGTEYKCRACGAAFTHRYALIENIFAAIHDAGVAEHCPGQQRGPRRPATAPTLGPSDPSASSELIRLRAGDGTEHYASQTTLRLCTYLAAKLDRWPTAVIELDVDDASLRVILRLLRYGPAAVPCLDPVVRVMAQHDADYLGVPSGLQKHLAELGEEAGEAERAAEKEAATRLRAWRDEQTAADFTRCDACENNSCRVQWRCVTCKREVNPRDCLYMDLRQRYCSVEPGLYCHDCPTCRTMNYAVRVLTCLLCDRVTRQ